jgi:hypothetical protein
MMFTTTVLGDLAVVWLQPAKKKAAKIISGAFTLASYVRGRTTTDSYKKSISNTQFGRKCWKLNYRTPQRRPRLQNNRCDWAFLSVVR